MGLYCSRSGFDEGSCLLYSQIFAQFAAQRQAHTNAHTGDRGDILGTNDQQVLNEDYQPIEGLYASGNTCGMRFGPEYITPIPGVSIGMCLTLGRELGKYLAAK